MPFDGRPVPRNTLVMDFKEINVLYYRICLVISQLLQYYAFIMTHQELKAGRTEAGLTQLQAAPRLRVSQSYLSQLENGTRPVTAALARRAASVYRLSATTLP